MSPRSLFYPHVSRSRHARTVHHRLPELQEAQEDCLHVVPLCGMITISDVTADGKAQPLLLRLRSKKLKQRLHSQ